tara:strand:- start:103 stop:336 length:234 start_codon:yes stop_codon:yes gene_type:complete
MEKEVLIISTLHIGSGSFPLEVYSDKTGTVEIFSKSYPVKIEKNKLVISETFPAKKFSGGAEERDYLLKWLKKELMG